MTQTNIINAQAQNIQKLMSEGVSLEQALQTVLSESKTQVRKDHVTYIKSLRNIPEVRRCRKIAYAKISKSKGKEEAIARYRLEIEAADEVLNELLGEVEAAEVPWKKAMELGEDAAGAFTYFIKPFKEKVDEAAKAKAIELKLTNAALKAEVNKSKLILGDFLPEELKEVAARRIQNQDMMVITIIRKANYLKSLEK